MTALLLQITISQGKEFWGDIFMCRSPGCIPIPMKKITSIKFQVWILAKAVQDCVIS